MKKGSFLLITIFSLILLLLAIYSGLKFYHNLKDQQEKKEIELLKAVSSLKLQYIIKWQENNINSVKEVLENQTLKKIAFDYLDKKDIKEDFSHFLETFDWKSNFDLVQLVNLNGEIITKEGLENHCLPCTVDDIKKAISKKSILITEIDQSECVDAPSISLIAPYILYDDAISKKIPFIVIFTAKLNSRLFPYIEVNPTSSKSFETLLVRREGDFVLFLNKLRFESEAKKKIPITSTQTVGVMAALGKEGFFYGKDYRGKDVLSYLSKIPETGWFLVSKEDREDVFVRQISLIFFILTFFILISMTFVILFLYERERKKHYKKILGFKEELLKQEKRHYDFIERINIGVYSITRDGSICYANPYLLNLFGYDSLSELIETNIFEHFLYKEERLKFIEEIEKNGFVKGYETCLVRKDGKKIFVIQNAIKVVSEELNIVYYDCSIADITERKLLEKEIIKGKNFIEAVVNNSPFIIVTLDKNGKITFLNRYGKNFLGINGDDFYGKDFIELFVPEKIQEQLYEVLKRLKNGEFSVYENAIITKRGEEKIVRWVNCVISEEGEIDLILSIGEDLTDKKKIEKEKEIAESKFLQAQKMESIGRLAGGIAHDFNNILTAITFNTDLALSKINEGLQIKEEVEQIKEATERAKDLTGGLLAFARKQIITTQLFDINEEIQKILKIAQRMVKEEVLIEFFPEDKKPLYVKMDKVQVSQIILNLITNAQDAIKGKGKITIETKNVVIDKTYPLSHPEFKSGNYALIIVSDNGSGMDEETKRHIFEPFFTTKEVGKGSGLGLATVFGIVKQNNGFINVYSELNKGTTFKIYIPKSEEAHKEEKEKESPVEMVSGSGKTIMVVEDDATILNLIGKVLKGQGYNVIPSTKPLEALEISQKYKEKIDLLITDVVMPEMNGKELSEKIRDLHPGIKVLYMSGYTSNGIANQGIIEKGIFFIGKPFSIKQLLQKVKEIIFI